MTVNDLPRLRDALRVKAPLVLNITNYVAMNISANALLSVGASPLMSFYADEMDDLMAHADSLCVNIGCLDSQQVAAIRRAVTAAECAGKPWVLDPVGVGASKARTSIVNELLTSHHPTIIRCNASEIMAIHQSSATRGVDADTSLSDDDVIKAAKNVALRYNTVVSVSGATDYITDGSTLYKVTLGSPLMPRITAMGCTASAITAAFAATVDNPLDAAHASMLLMGYCGSRAAERAEGPGTFVPHFIDELH